MNLTQEQKDWFFKLHELTEEEIKIVEGA